MRNNTEKNLWCNLGETEEKLAGKAAKKKGDYLTMIPCVSVEVDSFLPD